MADGALLRLIQSVTDTLSEAIERHGATQAARKAEAGGDSSRGEPPRA